MHFYSDNPSYSSKWLVSEGSIIDWSLFLEELNNPTLVFTTYITQDLFSGELRQLIKAQENTYKIQELIIDALNKGLVNHVFYDPKRVLNLNGLDTQTKNFVVFSSKLKEWALVKANHIVLTSQLSNFIKSNYSKFEVIKDSFFSFANRVDRRWKIETSNFRIHLSFLIAGVQRCGTSSLFYYLCQHPQMAQPERKELHFFNRSDYSEDLRYYRSFFPLRNFYNKRVITGEATPEYSFYPLIMSRIQQALPKIKIILIVRDPVQRAISHYRAQTPHRRPESFRAAIKLDQQFFGDRGISNPFELDHYERSQNYISRGRYIDYVPFIYKSFPKQNLLLLKAEDMFADPLSVVNKCCEFLEVDKLTFIHSHNETDHRRKSNHLLRSLQSVPEPISAELEEELYSYFYRYNQMFYEFIQQDMKWDRQ